MLWYRLTLDRLSKGQIRHSARAREGGQRGVWYRRGLSGRGNSSEG